MISPGEAEFSVADRWIVSRFSAMLAQLDSTLRDYRFDLAASALYEFTWYEFCDWYLELTKPVLQGEASTEAQKRGTRRTPDHHARSAAARLASLIPFITEEIWQRVNPLAAPLMAAANQRASAKPPEMLMLTAFPAVTDFAADSEAEAEVAWMKQFILAVRQIRGRDGHRAVAKNSLACWRTPTHATPAPHRRTFRLSVPSRRTREHQTTRRRRKRAGIRHRHRRRTHAAGSHGRLDRPPRPRANV